MNRPALVWKNNIPYVNVEDKLFLIESIWSSNEVWKGYPYYFWKSSDREYSLYITDKNLYEELKREIKKALGERFNEVLKKDGIEIIWRQVVKYGFFCPVPLPQKEWKLYKTDIVCLLSKAKDFYEYEELFDYCKEAGILQERKVELEGWKGIELTDYCFKITQDNIDILDKVKDYLTLEELEEFKERINHLEKLLSNRDELIETEWLEFWNKSVMYVCKQGDKYVECEDCKNCKDEVFECLDTLGCDDFVKYLKSVGLYKDINLEFVEYEEDILFCGMKTRRTCKVSEEVVKYLKEYFKERKIPYIESDMNRELDRLRDKVEKGEIARKQLGLEVR